MATNFIHAPSIPVATYYAANRQAVIANAYSIKQVLKPAGYTYHSFSQTWRRSCTLAEFTEDYLLLRSLGVVADPETAALLLPPTKAAVKPIQPKPKPEPVEPVAKAISPIEGLRLAKERLCRLAASGRIVDAEDLKTLRECAVSIKRVLDEQARIEAEEQAYGSWQEEFAEDIAHEG